MQTLSNEMANEIFEDLKAAGYRPLIDKKQYAEIMGIKASTVDKYVSLGYGCPNYKKLGSAKNAKVLFSLRDVAEYLAAQTIKTA